MVPTPPPNARGGRRGRGRGRASTPRTPTAGASITVQHPDDESLALEEQFQERQRNESSPLSPAPITPSQYDQIMAKLEALSQENTRLREGNASSNDPIPTTEKGKAVAGRTRQRNAPRGSPHTSTDENLQPRANSSSSLASRNLILSAKVKDVPVLDDGVNPSLVQWQVLLKSKLVANMDHFASERERMTHVFACTTGKAATLLETAMAAQDDPEDAFPDWESMVEYLVSSPRNPHERADAREAYKALTMESDESFSDFKLKFLQYATKGRIAKSEWKDDLYDKLTDPLQDEMRVEVQRIEGFNEFADLTSGTDALLRRSRAQNVSKTKFVRTTPKRPMVPPLLPTTPQVKTASPCLATLLPCPRSKLPNDGRPLPQFLLLLHVTTVENRATSALTAHTRSETQT